MQPDSILDRVNDIEKYDRLARRNYGLSDNQPSARSLNIDVLTRDRTAIATEQQPNQTPAQDHLRPSGILLSPAVINALALGKVLLIAKALHLGDWADDRPLIYPTLLKSALFTIVLACFKILEDAGLGMYRGKSFQESIADLGGGTMNGILCVSLIMFVTLIPFFVLTELQGVLGEGKLMQLFFRSRSSFAATTKQSPDVRVALPDSSSLSPR